MVLTVIVPNRNRINFNTVDSKLFLHSLLNQSFKNFKILIIDGGSDNYNDIKKYINNIKSDVEINLIQYVLKDKKKFHKTLLNNIGIRHSDTPYIMTTDADIIFHKDFLLECSNFCHPKKFIESRVIYIFDDIMEQIRKNKMNIDQIFELCATKKIGKIKKRTTPGACQCTSKENWYTVHGYDEQYIGWGSEDMDLLFRIQLLKLKVIWLGEKGKQSIKLLHQPHFKNYEEDMKCQDINMKRLYEVRSAIANPYEWGGIKLL